MVGYGASSGPTAASTMMMKKIASTIRCQVGSNRQVAVTRCHIESSVVSSADLDTRVHGEVD
jgi:hypothetical protein